jgi:D-Tyr-tRNAtyr deacylase
MKVHVHWMNMIRNQIKQKFQNLEILKEGENLLRCITQDEKGLVLTTVLFTLYFDPHKK